MLTYLGSISKTSSINLSSAKSILEELDPMLLALFWQLLKKSIRSTNKEFFPNWSEISSTTIALKKTRYQNCEENIISEHNNRKHNIRCKWETYAIIDGHGVRLTILNMVESMNSLSLSHTQARHSLSLSLSLARAHARSLSLHTNTLTLHHGMWSNHCFLPQKTTHPRHDLRRLLPSTHTRTKTKSFHTQIERKGGKLQI